jgi:YcxB-like protein
MISLHYTIEKKDYVNYYLHAFLEEPKIRKKNLIKTLKQSGSLLLYFLIISYSVGIRTINKYSIPLGLLLFVTTILPLITRRASLIKQAESITEIAENENIFTENTFIPTDADFQIKNKFCEVKYFWNAIIKKTENSNYYFLFVNEFQAIIIPKRAFKNNEELQAFDKILSRNLSLDAELKDALP